MLRKLGSSTFSDRESVLLVGPIEAHVVLSIMKHRHIAEIQVKSRNAVFSGTQETADLYASIGEVAADLVDAEIGQRRIRTAGEAPYLDVASLDQTSPYFSGNATLVLPPPPVARDDAARQ